MFHRMLIALFLPFLLLAIPLGVEAAVSLTVVGDIWQQKDSPAAVGTTFLRQDGIPYLRVDTGHDTAPGGNASMDLQNLLPLGPDGSGRTGLNIRCDRPVLIQACSELVLHNTPGGPDAGNLNFSAMADGTYRIGQEFQGNGRTYDIEWATEDGVTPGTEVYLKFDADRAGNSQPIALVNGHLRFDVQNRGGFANKHWIGRGGEGLEFNAPLGDCVQFNVEGVRQFQACRDAGGGRIGFYGTPGIYKPVVSGSRSNGTALASLVDALEALGLIVDATSP